MDLNVVEILSYGLSGLSFLFMYMTYQLIRKEQDKEHPRQQILNTIYFFMGFIFLNIVIVGVFGLPALSKNQELTVQAQKLTQKVDTLAKTNDTLMLRNEVAVTQVKSLENNNAIVQQTQNPQPEVIEQVLNKEIVNLQNQSRAVKDLHPDKKVKLDKWEKELTQKKDSIHKFKKDLRPKDYQKIIADYKNYNQKLQNLNDPILEPIQKRMRDKNEKKSEVKPQ